MSRKSTKRREKALQAGTARLYSDIGTRERRQHDVLETEYIDEKSEGVDLRTRVKVRDPLVLDSYKRRKLISDEQFADGLRIRAVYLLATGQPRLLSRYDEYISAGSIQNVYAGREDAFREYNRAMAWIGPIASGEVRRVCVEDVAAGGEVSMEIFRRGLDRLRDYQWRVAST